MERKISKREAIIDALKNNQPLDINISAAERKILALEIINSNDESLDEILWVRTAEQNPELDGNKYPYLNTPISRREIMLSRLIGRPYPAYFLETTKIPGQRIYRNEVGEPREAQADFAHLHRNVVSKNKDKASTKIRGKITFGYIKDEKECDEYIEVSENDLLRAGLKPELMGFEEIEIEKEDGIVYKSKNGPVKIRFGADYFRIENEDYSDLEKKGTQEYTLSKSDMKRLAEKGILEKRGRKSPYAFAYTHFHQNGPDYYMEYGGLGKNKLIVVDMGDELGLIAEFDLIRYARDHKPRSYGDIGEETEYTDNVYGIYDGEKIRHATLDEIEKIKNIAYRTLEKNRKNKGITKKDVSEADLTRRTTTREVKEARALLDQIVDLDKGKGEEK